MSSPDITKLIKENLLYCEYQPVANSGNISIFAHEALMRSKHTNSTPYSYFNMPESLGIYMNWILSALRMP